MQRFFWLLSGACLLAILPAEARPRDDALSGAFRCAVIADSRQWLDCYYGAAQPARAALGLAPALPAQVKLASAPPAGGAPRDEAVRDEVMAGAAACIRAANERAWLDCYYNAAMPMRGALGLSVPAQAARPLPQMASAAPAMPAPAAPPAPSGPPPMPRNGGLFTGFFSSPKPVVRGMPMQSFSMNGSGAFIVTLADGEVWEQLEEDQVYHPAHWKEGGPGRLVTISAAPMNTFEMKVSGEYGVYKVRRVR
jgi:hypothetical protein